jgi:hypothetical protein
MEPEAHDDDDDAVPVASSSTERDTQQITEPMPIPVPVPVPNYDMPPYSMNMGSEVWGGDPSSSSVPVVIPSSEKDVKQAESTY